MKSLTPQLIELIGIGNSSESQSMRIASVDGLDRPPTAGQSVTLVTQGVLDGILFTSPKTVDHFIEIARDRDSVIEVRRGLSHTIVGVIGTLTERAARRRDVPVDVKPETVCFEQLADRVVDEISGSTP